MAAIYAAIYQFTLYGLEKAFNHGIVPTIPLSTHAAQHVVFPKRGLKHLAGVLASPVTVVNETRRRVPPAHRHMERTQRQFCGHGTVHRPAHNRSGKQIHGHGQIQPAFLCRDVGDVAGPSRIRCLRRKISVQQVWSHWKNMLAVCGFDELATGFTVQTKVTHQSSDSPDTVVMTPGRQFSLNPGRSIAPLVLMVDIFNEQFEMLIPRFSR